MQQTSHNNQKRQPYIQAKTKTNLTLRHSCRESYSLVDKQSFHQCPFDSSLYPPTSSSPKIVTQTLEIVIQTSPKLGTETIEPS